ncbi:MAG TPA: exodeoxyribonuclease I [Candidatus Saccharimonadales bacterium]|nr:exodeoxyribonuclease I [Candidatus Saccharimonadales bacterium]
MPKKSTGYNTDDKLLSVMANSFFFYDLETSGFSPRSARVMQFGGQRTDMDLKPVGDPVNILIKLTPDVLPSPDAIMITGITPQQTLADGMTEAEFLKFFYDEIVRPGTIFIGYNSIRFDDEFMRFFNYRNFYDAYEWQWKDNCSRWDLLDVVRMTRALRPDGIEWPFAPDGKPANRLEYLTTVNKLPHSDAHDALSDVLATIEVAKLIKKNQPKLFKWLLDTRAKRVVAELVEAKEPFVYTSGKYSSEYLHTTVTVRLGQHPERDAALIYDLRADPTPFLKMSVDELAEAWKFTQDPEAIRLPIKTLKYNRCPAVAPLGVISDKEVQKRLSLDMAAINRHLGILRENQESFGQKVAQAVGRLDRQQAQAQTGLIDDPMTADERLYEGFISDADKSAMRAVRAASPDELGDMADSLNDPRLKNLLPLYKARNYPDYLSSEERAKWEEFCRSKLLTGGNDSRLAKYFARLEELAADKDLPKQKRYLLEELKLYGESIIPADADG